MDNDTKNICRYIIQHANNSVALSLENGTHPDSISPCGLRLLEVALGTGNVTIVKLLLDAGADVNAMSGEGNIEILADVMVSANFFNNTRRLK